MLPRRPKIPDRFVLIPVRPGEVRLHSHTYSVAVDSSFPNLLAQLLPLLDGTRRTDEVVGELRAFGEDRVVAVLERLHEAGLLEDGEQETVTGLSQRELDRYRDQITFFSHFAMPGGSNGARAMSDVPRRGVEYQERLKAAQVAVVGLGRLGSQLVRLLTLAGVGQIVGIDDGLVSAADANTDAWYNAEQVGQRRDAVLARLVEQANPDVVLVGRPAGESAVETWAPALAGCSLAVLCSDRFDPSEYERFNAACLQAKTTWTSCRLIGFELLVGPTVIPFETPCYACFEARQRGNLTDYEEYLLLDGFLRAGSLETGALLVTPGVGVVALEVVKALTHFVEPSTYGHLLSLNLLSLDQKLHPILRLPRCKSCGQPSKGRPTIQLWQPPES